MRRGKIKSLVADRGFGFIEGTDGHADCFFHLSVLQGVAFEALAEGIVKRDTPLCSVRYIHSPGADPRLRASSTENAALSHMRHGARDHSLRASSTQPAVFPCFPRGGGGFSCRP